MKDGKTKKISANHLPRIAAGFIINFFARGPVSSRIPPICKLFQSLATGVVRKPNGGLSWNRVIPGRRQTSALLPRRCDHPPWRLPVPSPRFPSGGEAPPPAGAHPPVLPVRENGICRFLQKTPIFLDFPPCPAPPPLPLEPTPPRSTRRASPDIRENALEKGFVDGNIFNSHRTLSRFPLDDPIDEQEGISVRNDLLNRLDI